MVGRERVCGPLPFSVCARRFISLRVCVQWGSGCEGRVRVYVMSCVRYVSMEGVEESCVWAL